MRGTTIDARPATGRTEQDEAGLVERIPTGDRRAFETLYRACHPRLARFLQRMTRSTPLTEEIVTTLTVTPRINFGNDYAAKFVGRDSPQFADRIAEPLCTNNIVTRTGGVARVQHCGGMSQRSVASGGRMGQVVGEDAVEVAPPPTACTHKCQAQHCTRGGAVVLGAPFPVAEADRLKARLAQ